MSNLSKYSLKFKTDPFLHIFQTHAVGWIGVSFGSRGLMFDTLALNSVFILI